MRLGGGCGRLSSHPGARLRQRPPEGGSFFERRLPVRTTATLHFDDRGELVQLAVEVMTDAHERLALVVPPPIGPFDDPESVYVRAWDAAMAHATRQVPGQTSFGPSTHPQVLLRRATDPAA